MFSHILAKYVTSTDYIALKYGTGFQPSLKKKNPSQLASATGLPAYSVCWDDRKVSL